MYSFDNISFFRDGKRWFPIMGEIHYSRYPKNLWRESLLKMKAGGIDIASTYVFWIHHEEIEGTYDFSDNRDLNYFVKTCKECGIKLWLRIGPWAHGEARNGGFPDWLLKKEFEPRTNDERYFYIVEKWYKVIYKQVSDYLHSKKFPQNPIIGIQIENEYGHCGGLSGENGDYHMKRLIKIAKKIGFTTPFCTATGWGGAQTGGLIPVMGGYCDAPWDPRTTEIEPSGNYIFTYERNDQNIGSDYGLGEGVTFDYSKFPYLTAELGGGLQMTKHCRTVTAPKDIAAISIVKMGSGVNLLGYYMYHGGTNPDGKLTSLQESKETGYPNDVPEKSYDFNAPIREYGQIAPVFKELKLLSLFTHDFGSELCSLPALIPEDNPLKPDNFTNLRYSYRTDGKKGYIFINNYIRHQKTPEYKEKQLLLPDKKETIMTSTIHSGEFFFIPFNLKFGDVEVLYADCSPLCSLVDGTTVFYAREYSTKNDGFFQFSADSLNKNDIKFLIISRENALNAWKLSDGKLMVSENDIIQDTDRTIIINGMKDFSFFVYPDFEKTPAGFTKGEKRNLNIAQDLNPVEFTFYSAEKINVEPTKNKKDIVFSEINHSKEKKYYKIDIWSIVKKFTENKKKLSLNDCFIKIFYEGESARLYGEVHNKKILIADNFFSGIEYPWIIGLKRFVDSGIDFSSLELEIFTLFPDEQIYFEKPIEFKNGPICNLNSIKAEWEWSCKLSIN